MLNDSKSHKGDYYRAAVSLLYNALRFRCLRLMGKPSKLTAVSLALTGRCNSHCIMCNIWKSAHGTDTVQNLDLSGSLIIDLLSRPLFSELVELDLTGGEPHLREDLVDIVLRIIRMKDGHLSRLRSIIITSNGLLPQDITSNYQRILYALKGTNIDLVSVTSLDGIGDTHDKVRGTKGAFEMASRTIDGLIELRKEHPNFIMGIKSTILPQNISMIGPILNFARIKNLFHIISPALFTQSRFRNIDKRGDLMLGTAEHKEVSDFYDNEELRTSYLYSRAHSFLSSGRKKWSCTALYSYLFIDFDGKVYPCEIISRPIGDVKKQDIEDIWNSSPALHWRKRIGKLKCCQSCDEPGAIRYSAFTEGLGYFKFMVKLGTRRFDKSLNGEGFSKYFDS